MHIINKRDKSISIDRVAIHGSIDSTGFWTIVPVLPVKWEESKIYLKGTISEMSEYFKRK